MKRTIFAMAAAAFLAAGCGQGGGVGASAERSAKTGTEEKTGIADSREMKADKSVKIAIKLPAFTLISDALFDGYDLAMLGASSRQTDTFGSDDPEVKNALAGVDTEGIFRKIQFDAIKEALKNGTDPRNSGAGDIPEAAIRAAQAGKSDAEIMTALGAKAAGADKKDYISAMAGCVGPLNGWEVDAMGDHAAVVKYMRVIAADCAFANSVFTEVFARLPQPQRDPDAASEAVRKAFNSIPTANLKDSLAKIKQQSAGWQFSADFTGFKGVHFTGSAGDFANSGSGFVVKKGGAGWFGEGNFSGKSGELALENATSATMSRKLDDSSTLSTGNDQTSKADAGVK